VTTRDGPSHPLRHGATQPVSARHRHPLPCGVALDGPVHRGAGDPEQVAELGHAVLAGPVQWTRCASSRTLSLGCLPRRRPFPFATFMPSRVRIRMRSPSNSATMASTLNGSLPTGSVGSWTEPPRLSLPAVETAVVFSFLGGRGGTSPTMRHGGQPHPCVVNLETGPPGDSDEIAPGRPSPPPHTPGHRGSIRPRRGAPDQDGRGSQRATSRPVHGR
jgi:hypothetical protein